MLANSEFVALLKQANTDSAKMAEVIGVSPAQLRYVTNTPSGMGLIKCGTVVIPFDNQISKDTNLYKLYNTNIHERIAEQKKAEQKKVEKEAGNSENTKNKMAFESQAEIIPEIKHNDNYIDDNLDSGIDSSEEKPKTEVHVMGTFLG